MEPARLSCSALSELELHMRASAKSGSRRKMIRIIIADDHALLREGLKATLGQEYDITVVGEAADAAEVQSVIMNVSADVLVLDISMPGASGLSIIKQVLAINKNLRVLVFSGHTEELFVLRALRQGAFGYVTKGSTYQELIGAIRMVASGRRYVPEALAPLLAEKVWPDRPRPPHDQLSKREYEVFLQIATGKSITRIAADLSLSVSTATSYRKRVLDKLGFSSNAEIVQYASVNNLLR